MGREAKFNFIPAHHASKLFAEDREWRITLQAKGQMKIGFPSQHPETKTIVGKYLQFFVDSEKNTLGWKVFERGDFQELKNYVPVKTYATGKSEIVSVSVTLPMKHLKHGNCTYKKLQVEKYKQQGMLNDGRTIFYITIPREVPAK